MKRGRGRRGLEMLHSMRENGIDMEIIEYDYDDIKEVDAKLVRLARHLGVNVLTTDYNLNRVASIEGVRVLNINELANAVRPVLIPGEKMITRIVQPGKEKNQGVGYLPDGTMIVVDGGDKLIGQDVEVEITRVFQTVAGKMLFAALNQTISKAPEAPKPKQGGQRGRQNDNRKDRKPQNSPQRDRKQQNRSQGSSKPTQDKPRSENRRPKRLSPTQKLENSLVELTGGEDDSR